MSFVDVYLFLRRHQQGTCLVSVHGHRPRSVINRQLAAPRHVQIGGDVIRLKITVWPSRDPCCGIQAQADKTPDSEGKRRKYICLDPFVRFWSIGRLLRSQLTPDCFPIMLIKHRSLGLNMRWEKEWTGKADGEKWDWDIYIYIGLIANYADPHQLTIQPCYCYCT